MAITMLAFTSDTFKVSAESSPALECATGWGSGGAEKKRIIPADWINDGYCDCPLDGLDELETGACSGSTIGGWAGIMIPPNNPPAVSEQYLECPFEPDLKLPPSHINDGICDCCDGSDETSTSTQCSDKCAGLREAQKAAREKAQKSFLEGSVELTNALADFEKLRQDIAEETETLKSITIPKLEDDIKKNEQVFAEKLLKYMSDRRNIIWLLTEKLASTNNGENNHIGLMEDLNIQEKKNLIIGICQISTEQRSYSSDKNECQALVKAGIELGFVWDSPNKGLRKVVQNVDTATYPENDTQYLSERLRQEILGINNEKAKKGKDNNDDDDIDLPDEDDDDVEKNLEDEEIDLSDKRAVVPRSNFKKAAHQLLRQISLALNADDDEGQKENENEEGNHESSDKEQSWLQNMDPISIQKLQNYLHKSLKQIESGETVAELTKALLDRFIVYRNVNDSDLMALATGVIFHSSISSADLVEVIYNVVPDFVLPKENDQNVCVNVLCRADLPVVQRKVQIPPSSLLSKYDERCQERVGLSSNVCMKDISDNLEIPQNIEDGYLNYFSFAQRNKADPLTEFFEPLSLLSENVYFQHEFEHMHYLKEQLEPLQEKVKNLPNELGGRDNKYGASGEFYALRDSCHSVNVAKYEYEICFHGKAHQREAVGGTHKGGTSLGRWTGYSYEDGQIVLNFSGGQRCWNGPSRSATVKLTCGGKGTRLVSVEEPETCRYAMEMESYIACDDTFARTHSLLEKE